MTGILLLLGYLDSNQEQMIAISVVPLPRNRGGIPRISAVFMRLVYALARTDTGSFWSRRFVSGAFLVTQHQRLAGQLQLTVLNASCTVLS